MKTRLQGSSLAVVFLLGGCGDQFEEAKAAAAFDLLDPSSAQFREVRQRAQYVCGQINGKNRMGAYAGFKNFLAYEDNGRWVAELFENGSDRSRFANACERNTDEELEETVAKGGDNATFAQTELDERAQDAITLPEACNVPWESRQGERRSVNFDFRPGTDREFEYFDSKIGVRNYGRYFFEGSPTTIRFSTANGEQKLRCDPRLRTAVITLEDGTEVRMVPLDS